MKGSEIRKLGKILFTCIVIGGIAFSLFHLFALLYLQRIDDAPYSIFFAMGRAILNGYTPYEDIFETKPPGLFVLAALSLGILKNTSLANIVQTLLLLVTPALFTLFAWKQAK